MATINTLARFGGLNGEVPFGGLTSDAAENLFGTTLSGGASDDGTVFEIAKTDAGYASAPVSLVSFGGSNGQFPSGSLIQDAAGNLFGTTQAGGETGDGTAFEIVKTVAGYASLPITLISFNATNGATPFGSLIADATGNLFGTTSGGGANDAGTVFEVAKTDFGYANTPISLVSFDGSNGQSPTGSLIADAAGNLFGTAQAGGAAGAGTVFEISKTNGGYDSIPTTLVSFDGSNGQSPAASLIADAVGDLFGTTTQGGANDAGTVFEIIKTNGGYASTPTTIVSFDGINGRLPTDSLIADATGNLFGTTSAGGAGNAGTVFEVPKTDGGYASTPTTLASFDGANGIIVKAGLIADAHGNLFGTTLQSSAPNIGGTVFEVTDTGFQAPCYVAGTHILTDEGERLVETLIPGDRVLTLLGGELTACPVKWIGHRRIDLITHPEPETIAPIRFLRDGLGSDMPHRDLLVSPDHAIFVEGKLICARQLVNGTTIRRETGWQTVEYFHVELDYHAILMAEGLPAESYIDTGNRSYFANTSAPLMLHPNVTGTTDYPSREAASCAPFVWDEASVRPIWNCLANRAAELGYPLPQRMTTTEADLHLLAGDRRIKSVSTGTDRALFVLPQGTREVQLVSRADSPTSARPWLEDRRRLGVRVARVVLRGVCEIQEVPLDHPRLSEGWWEVERDGTSVSRWTNGRAVLPLPVLSEVATLEICFSGSMIYTVEPNEPISTMRSIAA